jgi:hypothetical protein
VNEFAIDANFAVDAMNGCFHNQAYLLDVLQLDELTAVCLQLDLRGLIRIAQASKRVRHGDSGLETAELPTQSRVITALLEHAFPNGEVIPNTRPTGCSESWVAYLTRCARQRLCRETPPIAAGDCHSLFVNVAGRLTSCGKGAAVGHGDEHRIISAPTPVAAMARVRVRSVAAGYDHSLALSSDGRVYSWGENRYGQLGHGDQWDRPSPKLIKRFKGVCGIAAASRHSLAVTESGDVFRWGRPLEFEPLEFEMEDGQNENELKPIIVQGVGGVRVRRVCAGENSAFAIGKDAEFSHGGLEGMGYLSATATRTASPHPSVSRRCAAFG